MRRALVTGVKTCAVPILQVLMTCVLLCGVMTALATVLLTATGVDLVTAFSGAATAITNTGPSRGDIAGPAGTFAPLPDAAKWILSLAMLLGRQIGRAHV